MNMINIVFFLCFCVAITGFLATFVFKSTRGALATLLVVTSLNVICMGWGFSIWDESQRLYFLDNYFVSDALSRLFLILIVVVLVGFTPYVVDRVRINELAARNIHIFVRMVMLFLALCILVVFSNHLILMWLLLEATTLAVVPLIYH